MNMTLEAHAENGEAVATTLLMNVPEETSFKEASATLRGALKLWTTPEGRPDKARERALPATLEAAREQWVEVTGSQEIDYRLCGLAAHIESERAHGENERLETMSDSLSQACGHVYAGEREGASLALNAHIARREQRERKQGAILDAGGENAPATATLIGSAVIEGIEESYITGDYAALGKGLEHLEASKTQKTSLPREGSAQGATLQWAVETLYEHAVEEKAYTRAGLANADIKVCIEYGNEIAKSWRSEGPLSVQPKRSAHLEKLAEQIAQATQPKLDRATGALIDVQSGTSAAQVAASRPGRCGAMGRAWASKGGNGPTRALEHEDPRARIGNARSAQGLTTTECVVLERAFAGQCLQAPPEGTQARVRDQALRAGGFEAEALSERTMRCARAALTINTRWWSGEGAGHLDADGVARAYEGLWADGADSTLAEAITGARAQAGQERETSPKGIASEVFEEGPVPNRRHLGRRAQTRPDERSAREQGANAHWNSRHGDSSNQEAQQARERGSMNVEGVALERRQRRRERWKGAPRQSPAMAHTESRKTHQR